MPKGNPNEWRHGTVPPGFPRQQPVGALTDTTTELPEFLIPPVPAFALKGIAHPNALLAFIEKARELLNGLHRASQFEKTSLTEWELTPDVDVPTIHRILAGAGIMVSQPDLTVTDVTVTAVPRDDLPYQARWVKFTKTFADFSTAGTSVTVNVFTLPPRTFVHDVLLKHSQSFLGGGITAYTITFGFAAALGGFGDEFVSAFNVFAAPTAGLGGYATDEEPRYHFHEGTTLTMTAGSTTANLDQATQGILEAWLYISQVP